MGWAKSRADEMQLFDKIVIRAFGYRVQGTATLVLIYQLDTLEDIWCKQVTEERACGAPTDKIGMDSDWIILLLFMAIGRAGNGLSSTV